MKWKTVQIKYAKIDHYFLVEAKSDEDDGVCGSERRYENTYWELDLAIT